MDNASESAAASSHLLVFHPDNRICPSLLIFNFRMPELNITLTMVQLREEKMLVHRSAGPDGIHSHLVKILSPVIAGSLVLLSNLFLKLGAISNDQNRETVTPIHEKGSKFIFLKLYSKEPNSSSL